MLFGSAVSLGRLTEFLSEFIFGTRENVHLGKGQHITIMGQRFLRCKVFVLGGDNGKVTLTRGVLLH